MCRRRGIKPGASTRPGWRRGGADVTKVKCNDESLLLGVVDDLMGIEPSIGILEDETAETRLAWLRGVAEPDRG